jgi:hypothetical protein
MSINPGVKKLADAIINEETLMREEAEACGFEYDGYSESPVITVTRSDVKIRGFNRPNDLILDAFDEARFRLLCAIVKSGLAATSESWNWAFSRGFLRSVLIEKPWGTSTWATWEVRNALQRVYLHRESGQWKAAKACLDELERAERAP